MKEVTSQKKTCTVKTGLIMSQKKDLEELLSLNQRKTLIAGLSNVIII